MSKIVSFFQSIRLKAIFTTFLAGIVLLLNTACSNAAQARMPGSAPNADGGPHPVGQVQPYTGGMNNFDDAAPGQAVKGTAGKTRSLVDEAQRNINTKGLSPKEAIKDLGSRADDAKDDLKNVGDRAADKAQELGRGIQRGAQNVKDNTARAIDDTASGTKRAADRAASGAKDAID